MNAAAYERRELRRITLALAAGAAATPSASPVRSSSPRLQGITPSALRKKVHSLGPTASLNRVGRSHYVALVLGRRYEGTLSEVHDSLSHLF